MSNKLPIEKQVCTQPQAEELAGLLEDDAPESLWRYVEKERQYADPVYKLQTDCWFSEIYFYAYTGDELGEVLPSVIFWNHKKYFLDVYPSDKRDEWNACYVCVNDYGNVLDIQRESTQAQAKAALAIQGLKDGWIKKEDFVY